MAILAVSSGYPVPEHVGHETDVDHIPQHVQVGSFHNKRSLGSTLAFFTERINIMPQNFQGLGAQLYIFTK